MHQVDMVDLMLDSRHRHQRMAPLLLLGTMPRLPSLEGPEGINMGRLPLLRSPPRATTLAIIRLVNINMGKEATSLAGGK
jgi:hypothetical protein